MDKYIRMTESTAFKTPKKKIKGSYKKVKKSPLKQKEEFELISSLK
jgi:hypothetical protein